MADFPWTQRSERATSHFMNLSQEQFTQICEQIFTTIKRIVRYVDWPGVMGLLGFLSLALVSLSRGYPSYFVFTLSLIGLVLVWFAARNSYNQKSTALVDKYEERFFERMKIERKSAAQYLLGEQAESGELEDILDFFQTPIAEKVISGEIDERQVYSLFYHWIRLYWEAGQKYIEDYRKGEPAAWESLKTLYDRMSTIEKAEVERDLGRRCTDQELVLTPEKSIKYLQQEARLKTYLLVKMVSDSNKCA
ncbi:MAG: hypothetical protein WCD80_13740 [Desulfobaccales bacterium]